MGRSEPLSRPHDESAFAALVEPHRRGLQVHCYRMLGSFEDSEDLVQETLLRAWRSRASFGFGDRSSFRAWLYRIATNACLDVLRRRPPRVMPPQLVPPGDRAAEPPPPADLPWLQPYPDRLLEPVAPAEHEPGAVVVARETMEIAFLVAIQRLPPRQRAVLVLRDVLGWSAKDTAALLEASVVAVNSALQRARATLRAQLPKRRTDWVPSSGPTEEERELRSHRKRASTPNSVGCKASSRAPTCSPPPPTTCGGRARRSTGRWRSTCYGSTAG